MKMKRITTIVLASCLTICLASPAFAAPYDYTVKVSGGTQGEYTGSASQKIPAGETWGPSTDDITVTDDKYYVKGFHLSGQDEPVGAIPITEDTTFVASYGIKGSETVSYTIHYVDEAGATLAEDATYYGNVGDKPVVGYRDIEGYLPRDTYNVTWTLTGNGDEYSFVYIPANTTETVTNEVTNTVTGEGETVTVAGAGTAAGTATGAAGTTTGATGAAGGAAAGGAAAGDAGAAGPADIVDLDDQDVPLAGVDDANGDNGDGTTAEAGEEETINDDQVPTAGISTAAKAGIGVIIAAIVAIIAAIAVRARRGKKEEEV